MLGIGVKKGLIGVIDDGTNAPFAKFPAAVSYTAKAGVFGGAIADTGAAGVSTTGVGVFGQGGNAKGLPAGWSCGVLGASAGKPGVIGWSSTSQGVEGLSTTSDGVRGASEYGIGVSANSINSTGVHGASTTSTGVYGQSGKAPATDNLDLTSGVGGVIGTSRDQCGVVGISEKSAGLCRYAGAWWLGRH